MGRKRQEQHGMSKTREFGAWASMKDRCRNPNNLSFHNYGGRGIKVCDRWLASFLNFYADMGPRPDGLSLERRNNDGNYEPENCYWATRKQQLSNTRQNRIIEYKGERKTLMQWCELYQMPFGIVWQRLAAGWTMEQSLDQRRRTKSEQAFTRERNRREKRAQENANAQLFP